MPTAKACFMLGLMELASQPRIPSNVMTRKTSPETKTAPRRSCQPIPREASPKAMKAFSPMYGATAIGRLAIRPMAMVPNPATRMVARVEGPAGIPAAVRMAGFTTTM